MQRLAKLAAAGACAAFLAAASIACGSSKAQPTQAIPTVTGTPSDPNAVTLFDNLTTKFETSTVNGYRVVYDVKSLDPQQGSFSATLTIQQKGQSTRSEFDGTLNGGHAKFETLFDGKQLFVCDEQAKRCAATPQGASLVDPLAMYAPKQVLEGVTSVNNITIHAAPSQQLAGIDAKCFRLNRTDAQSTFCLDPNSGLLLLVDATAQGGKQTLSMRATQASTDVGSLDVKPPYPVVSATATATPK